jgi:phospholipase C
VVVIFQENRTPDNLFQDPALIAKGADIQSFGVDSKGETIPLLPGPLGTDYDLSHAHQAFVSMYDGGKMDGAERLALVGKGNSGQNPALHPQFGSVNASDVQPYFRMAETYTFGDRMFQTNQGPSFPAHQYIISGTSAPSANSNLFVAENPDGNPKFFTDAGCTAPPDEFVFLIDPAGKESSSIYPCFDHPTLSDQFNTKGISWRYYAPSAGSIWTAPNAIEHMCVPNAPIPNATLCTGPDWTNHVVLNQAQVLSDIAAGTLDSVTWVIPTGLASDHPGSKDANQGPSWVA